MEENINVTEIRNRRQNNNRNKRRLFLLLLMIVVTGVLLTTTSYAWFTANETVTVNTINVNVAAKNGIQISTDATTWKSIVQTEDIINATALYPTNVNQLPSAMEPVSTVGTIDATGKMEMFYGVVDTNDGGDYILTATQSVETRSSGAASNGQFVAFDLFFQVTEDTDIDMTATAGVTTTDAEDKGIKNAARIAFVILGNQPTGTNLATLQTMNAGATATKYIWEPNFNAHTEAGVSNARDVYGLTTTIARGACSIDPDTNNTPALCTAATGTWTPTSILAYDGVKAEILAASDVLLTEASSTEPAAAYCSINPATNTSQILCEANAGIWRTTHADLFDPVTINYSTPEAFTEDFQIFSLSAGITKIRVYMWVEGQDVDCENTASGGNIDFDLQITIHNEG